MTLPFADNQATLIIPTDDDPPMEVVLCWLFGALVGVPVLPRLHVALVAAELVDNARQHGSPPYVLRLALDEPQRAIGVCVEDCTQDSAQPWPSGAGLVLVEGLSRAWGVERRARAKTVWAEVPLGVRTNGLVVPPQPPPGA